MVEKCKGITNTGKRCFRMQKNKEYCDLHQYFLKFTENEISKIINKQFKSCIRCKKWHMGKNKQCPECTEYNKLDGIKRREAIIRCKGIDRNLKECNNKPVNDTNFCNFHQYMLEYTENQMKDLKLCSTCRMMKFMNEYNTCENCRARGEGTRKEIKDNLLVIKQKYAIIINKKNLIKIPDREYNNTYDIYTKNLLDKPFNLNDYKIVNDNTLLSEQEKLQYIIKYKNKICDEPKEFKKFEEVNMENKIIMCRLINCKFKCNISGYCGKHLVYGWREFIESSNYSVCKNYERGCRYIFDKKNSNKLSLCVYCKNDIVYILRNIKKGAYVRNIKFELDDNQIINLIKNPCEYCGCDENFNGLDRMDSKKWYTIENVVPCCKYCNIMKYTYEINKFYEHCKNIYLNHNQNNDTIQKEENINLFENDYDYWRTQAQKRDKEFNLSIKKFNNLKLQNCYYCKNTNSNKNGIDRIDNNKGYLNNNVVTCCSVCNLMKSNMHVLKFVEKIKNICLFKNLND